MSTILSDIRYSVRSLRRRPVFTAVAMATIAIGIGANAAVFTVVSGIMLRPLAYAQPDELIAIWGEHPRLGWSNSDINPANAWDWRERARSLQDLYVARDRGFNLTGVDVPEELAGLEVTPNFLTVLGRTPAVGRDFLPDEIGEGGDRVAILTDGFWERRFARDPEVLGSTIVLDGDVVTVIGITPADFVYHDDRVDLFRPWGVAPWDQTRGGSYAEAVARLADGSDVAAARAELVAIADDLAAEHEQNEGWTVSVVPLHDDVVGDVARQASIVLMGAVGFVLLMACVNVANLLLARAGGRGREIAVRVALGAGRGRLTRQLLTESFVLAAAGGAVGLALANWGYQAIVAGLPPDMPPVFRFGIDRTVLLFTVAITGVAALLFGGLPALRTTSGHVGALRDGGRSGRSRSSGRFGGALVVLQTSMAMVLLVGGALLMKSLTGMRTQDFGFDPQNVLTARVGLPEGAYPSAEASAAFWRDLLGRVRETPGVVAAGTTQSHPLMGSNWGRSIRIAGQDMAEDESLSTRLTYASPGLFEALDFRMVRGRPFEETDGPDAPNVAIVNETLVERYLASQDPIGTTLLAGESWSAVVVGVVHDVIERGVEVPPEPALYLPIAQTDVRERSIVLETTADPTALAPALQEAVWAIDANLPVSSIMTMDAVVEQRVGGFAVIGELMATFALLSLILGAVGIYGVTAHAAGQRTAEIGVRLAMGAERADVVRMVIGQGALRAVVGLAIGLTLAAGMGGAMSSILIGVSPRDPVIFGGVTLVLATVSFLGLWLPARRAARIDPVNALAAE